MMYNGLSENSSLMTTSRKEGPERVKVSIGDSGDWESAGRSSLRRRGKIADVDGWGSGGAEGREPTRPRRAFIEAREDG